MNTQKNEVAANCNAVSNLLADIKPYYTKTETEKLIGKGSGWRKRWESFCVENIPDFGDKWEERQPFNFHQAFCLAWLSDLKKLYPSLRKATALEIVNENLPDDDNNEKEFYLTIFHVMKYAYDFKKSTQTKSANIRHELLPEQQQRILESKIP